MEVGFVRNPWGSVLVPSSDLTSGCCCCCCCCYSYLGLLLQVLSRLRWNSLPHSVPFSLVLSSFIPLLNTKVFILTLSNTTIKIIIIRNITIIFCCLFTFCNSKTIITSGLWSLDPKNGVRPSRLRPPTSPFKFSLFSCWQLKARQHQRHIRQKITETVRTIPSNTTYVLHSFSLSVSSQDYDDIQEETP